MIERYKRPYVKPTITALFQRKPRKTIDRDVLYRLVPNKPHFEYEYRAPDDDNPSGMLTIRIEHIPPADICAPSSSGKTIMLAKHAGWLRQIGPTGTYTPRIYVQLYQLVKHFKDNRPITLNSDLKRIDMQSSMIRGSVSETLSEAIIYIRVEPRDSINGNHIIYATTKGPSQVHAASSIPIFCGCLIIGKKPQ